MKTILQIENRDYSKWHLTPFQTINILPQNVRRHSNDTNSISIVPLEPFQPLHHKFFHGDVLEIAENNTISLLSSPFLEAQPKSIPAILILSDGKTYGRTENKKKLLYRCIPNDTHLPIFLVPYEITLELSKHIVNKYVLIKYKNWDEKHPRGELIETIGNVNNYEAFENYQLHCKDLHISLSGFTKQVKTKCANMSGRKSIEEHYSKEIHFIDETQFISTISQKYAITDRSMEYVFSIDNSDTTDFDDAMSITEIDGKTLISIYISNVLIWIEELGLWNAFSERVSTIYLPTKKYSMIPSLLSENYCSLVEKHKRFAIAVDFIIYPDGSITIEFRNTIIVVKRNFRYEEEKLLKNTRYQQLLSITKELDKTIIDSHELVAYWMIKTNEAVGEQLFCNKMGIFRKSFELLSPEFSRSPTASRPEILAKSFTVGFTENFAHSIQPISIGMSILERTLFHIKNNISSQYKAFEENELYYHSSMNIHNYVHFTSPIRRLVDLLNQLYLWKIMGYCLSDSMALFLETWVHKIDIVNTQMKSIRKIQSICDLLHMVTTTPTILDNIYIGTVININYTNSSGREAIGDKENMGERSSNELDMYTDDTSIIENHKYTIYIESLKYIATITSSNILEVNQCIHCKIFVFNDKDTIQQKVIIQPLE
jgi:exoribonuclease R